jgi:hypothetical protein
MMKREIKDRLISASTVTLFFAAVRPSVVPKMWITVLLAFALYEGILLGLAVSRDVRRATGAGTTAGIVLRMPSDGRKSGSTR